MNPRYIVKRLHPGTWAVIDTRDSSVSEYFGAYGQDAAWEWANERNGETNGDYGSDRLDREKP